MDGSAQLDVLRERIRLIVLTTIAIAAATFVVLSVLPKQYEAEARLLVGDIVGAQNPTIDDLQLAKELASTYAVIATTRPIAEKVIAELKLSTTPDKLLDEQVSAIPGLDTPYVAIKARAADPALAARIANAFAAEVEALAPSQGGAGSGSSLIQVVEPAVPPLDPAAPRIVLFTALALIAGGALGIFLAFAREYLHPRIRSSAAVTALTGLRTLAVVPGRRGIGKSNNAWNELRAEYVALRNNLMAIRADAPTKKVLVTGLRLGDGVSTVAQGLAIAFAAAGSKVIIVDQTSSTRGVEPGWNTPGRLTTPRLRSGQVALAPDDHLAPTRNPGIFTLQNGMVWPVTGTNFERVDVMAALDQVALEGDVVIVDGPPVLGGIEAVSLGASVDVAVLVVNLKKARRRDLELAATSLAGGGVDIAGFVANRPLTTPWADSADAESPYGPAIDRIGSELRATPSRRKRAVGRN